MAVNWNGSICLEKLRKTRKSLSGNSAPDARIEPEYEAREPNNNM
jgi:hypothetical protein